MLDIIEQKLLLIKKMAEAVKEQNLSEDESQTINIEINNLAELIRALAIAYAYFCLSEEQYDI